MEKLNQNQRIILSIYVVWTFIHLIFLTIAERDSPAEYFWPFEIGQNRTVLEAIPTFYDFSEFLVYVGSPIIIYIIYNLIKEKNEN